MSLTFDMSDNGHGDIGHLDTNLCNMFCTLLETVSRDDRDSNEDDDNRQ